MKRFFLFLGFLSIACCSQAHDFFFSYAELEYNEMNHRMEATLYATTHDLEKELREESGLDIKLYGHESDTAILNRLEKKVNSGFKVTSDAQQQYFSIDGIEIKLNGTIYFYLSSEVVGEPSKLKVQFDFLMKTFQEQQNKLDFKFHGRTNSYVFMLQNKQCVIELSKNDE
ncbi:MAG: DUF6702 family protein [Bacteroidota bacterium]